MSSRWAREEESVRQLAIRTMLAHSHHAARTPQLGQHAPVHGAVHEGIQPAQLLLGARVISSAAMVQRAHVEVVHEQHEAEGRCRRVTRGEYIVRTEENLALVESGEETVPAAQREVRTDTDDVRKEDDILVFLCACVRLRSVEKW